MIPHAELAESTFPQISLRPLDPQQRLARDGIPVGDARGKTGRCRLVPHRQFRLMRQRADIRLRQPRVHQRRRDAVIQRRLLPGPEIAAIIEIHAVGQMLKTQPYARFLHFREQLTLAVKAPLQIVLHILRVLHLVGPDDLQRNPLPVRELNRVVEMSPRQRGGIGQHGKHPHARQPAGAPREKRRVDSARIGDQHAAQLTQTLLQPRAFFGERIHAGNEIEGLMSGSAVAIHFCTIGPKTKVATPSLGDNRAVPGPGRRRKTWSTLNFS